MTEEKPEEKMPDLGDMIKDLSEFVEKKYGGKPIVNIAPVFTPPPIQGGPGKKKKKEKKFKLEFDYTPKQVKEYLDRYVIKQEESKKVLSDRKGVV